MSKSKRGRSGIAGGRKVKTVSTAVNSMIQGITVYMEMANASRLQLLKDKILPMGIDLRLQVERDLCMNILVNICKLKQSYIQTLRAEVCENKEKFDNEVHAFCEAIVPKKKRSRIVLSKNFNHEEAALTGRNKAVKKGRVII